jgi:predicted negative regulator of RcsB-dependent stress response
MGRTILLIVICFAAYWAWQYYKNRQQPKASGKSNAFNSSKVDELIAEFKSKIADIESKSTEEIKRSEELLAYYKQELEKLNNLKNI